MKKSFFRLFSIMLFGLAVLTFQSCDPDACSNVVCQNGGACFEGVCNCPDGFTGTNCEIDVCASVTCQNGGTCNTAGTCDCAAGYSGTNCEIEQRTLFLGEYDASEVCSSNPSFVDTYIMPLKTRAAAANEFYIENIYNLEAQGVPTQDATVVATMTGDTSFEIISQALSGIASSLRVESRGTHGTIDGTTVTIEYTIIDTSTSPNGRDDCTITLTPR